MSQSLKELGRSEGRVLITNLTRFAITPWCHATINEQKLKGLNKQDINILTQAFRQSLIKKLGLTS